MIRILSFIFVLLFCAQSQAARMTGQLLLGFQESAFQLGGDFDYQTKKSHSIGGYFFFAPEDAPDRTIGYWSIGGTVKVFFGPENWQLYVGPGFGITQFDLPDPADDEMAFGSMVKLGMNYVISEKVSFGLEQMIFTNWFNADAPGGFTATNLSVRYIF